MIELKAFLYFFLSGMFLFSTFVHSNRETRTYKSLSSGNPKEQIVVLEGLPNNPILGDIDIQILLMDIAYASGSPAVRPLAQEALDRSRYIYVDLEFQKKLVRRAIASAPRSAETGLFIDRVKYPHLIVQQELAQLATSGETSEEARAEAEKILGKMSYLDLEIQQKLLHLATSAGILDYARSTAGNVLVQTDTLDPRIYEELIDLAVSSDSNTVRNTAQGVFSRIFSKEKMQIDSWVSHATADGVSEQLQSAAKNILINSELDFDLQHRLFHIATSDEFSETARARAQEILQRTRSLHRRVQQKLLHLATSDEFSETAQARAKEILLGTRHSLHLQVQGRLVSIALTDVSDKARNAAKGILINMELDWRIPVELVQVATAFSVSPDRKLFSNDSVYESETTQARAKEILMDMSTYVVKAQEELVYIATSYVALKEARAKAKDILIQMNTIALEAQQELLNLAKYNILSVRARAWNILSQLENIHPEIASSMGISLKCRRAFRRWVPTFGVAK